ncbi:MAG: hypothetical protein ACE15F_17465, partial [bacterium]
MSRKFSRDGMDKDGNWLAEPVSVRIGGDQFNRRPEWICEHPAAAIATAARDNHTRKDLLIIMMDN